MLQKTKAEASRGAGRLISKTDAFDPHPREPWHAAGMLRSSKRPSGSNLLDARVRRAGRRQHRAEHLPRLCVRSDGHLSRLRTQIPLLSQNPVEKVDELAGRAELIANFP